MNQDPVPPSCVVVVPVKPPTRGKSRLVGLDDEQRRSLAEAFALDTVAAARAASRVQAVLVVTDDFRLAAALRAQGCEVVPDGVSEDLNATLVQGAAEVERRWPGAVPVALCADLPALRADELDAVLAEVVEQVSRGRATFVRDRAGTGTTLYAATSAAFAPSFGTGSAERHASGGAAEVGAERDSLRADVDDLVDLGVAMVLGLGEHTARASGRRATHQG
ncbi:2-phospho-L-lactate guanylyltransferase [Nocardioides sp. J2M5]|uniref:2-phospho-L-lactate guanylyltransferase n=1 Tax=Nocardioides palaemonis TaxID=2829810 RepID=UPI001BAD8692|nr:2-phospho-L-lactate guanylyltransferase [Nocardioides palaemonis]MBS2937381.1 2-phospho-L-lactate guanylyltransferase [Nocardioides palaemonis]